MKYQSYSYSSHMSRNVPFVVLASCLFGGVLNQIAWIFFSAGMIFVWIFAGSADLSFFMNLPQEQLITGRLLSSQQTSMSENDVSIYKNSFSFDYRGQKYEGSSYSLGSIAGQEQSVMVPEGRPDLARIRDQRRKEFGPFILIVLIFPLIGLGIILFGLARSIKQIRLLRSGVLAEGKFLRKEATGVMINERPVYQVFFEYTAADGQKYVISDKTHLLEKVLDQDTERLLYDPSNPGFGMLVDALQGSPKMDQSGRLHPTGLSYCYLLLPTASLIGNGYYLSTYFR